MQTFLSYPDIRKSLEFLDSKRLNKQRLEVFQMLRALNGEVRGWVNHPATQMWKHDVDSLAYYGIYCSVICNERGIQDHSRKLRDIAKYHSETAPIERNADARRFVENTEFVEPWWWGSILHESHFLNLLWKTKRGKVTPQPHYWWPVYNSDWHYSSPNTEDEVIITRYAKPKTLRRKANFHMLDTKYDFFLTVCGERKTGFLLQI